MSSSWMVDGRTAVLVGAGAALATYVLTSRNVRVTASAPATAAVGSAPAAAAQAQLSSPSERKWEPPRDVIGYGANPPDAQWPRKAKLALNFVVNIEEGSEPSIGDGDASSSASLCECGSDAPPGVRDLAAEGMFEYGSRCGIWRVFRAFGTRELCATAFTCALAVERVQSAFSAHVYTRCFSDAVDAACTAAPSREDHLGMEEDEERARIKRAVDSITRTLGAPPQGWYCRTAPSVNTRRLLVEHGGFVYDSDAYNDDLPYWVQVPAPGNGGGSGGGGCGVGSGTTSTPAADSTVNHLVLPYSLCTNDSKFAPGRAFSTADDFFTFMKDSIDTLIEEAEATSKPKMMSIGLHPRLIGHPARIKGLERLLDYVKSKGDDVWVCRRSEIAQHWMDTHPPSAPAAGNTCTGAGVTVGDFAVSMVGSAAAAATTNRDASMAEQPTLSAGPSSAPGTPLATAAAFASRPKIARTPVLAGAHRNNGSSGGSVSVAGRAILDSDATGPRLLVTGGAGFVLSNLVQHWLTSDETSTAVIFDQHRAWDGSAQDFLGAFISSGRLGFYDGDVTSAASWEMLEQAHGNRFTHVVSGAAITPTEEEERRNPSRIMEVNLQGTLKCLEFARLRLPGLKRCVHVSSDAVLGVEGLVSPSNVENPPTDPKAVPAMSMYALAKVGGEAAVQRWKVLFGMDVVSVRFSDVYGRLDRDTGARNRHNALYWVCRKVLALEAHATSIASVGRVVGAKETVRMPSFDHETKTRIKVKAPTLDSVCWDMVDAPSVARGITTLLKAETKPKRHVYHLALGRTPTIREALEAALGRKMSMGDLSKVEIVDSVVSNDGVDGEAGVVDVHAAVKGAVDVESLGEQHWLLSGPMDVAPMADEFGWCATPLDAAVNEYMAHLRQCKARAVLVA